MSSRPIHLLANGEWEIRSDAGAKPLQYGLWQLKNEAIVWTVRIDGQAQHEVNPLVSYAANRFVLREAGGSQTSFDRMQ